MGAQRHNGFLAGLGLPAPPRESNELGRPPEVACMADSYGDQTRGQTAMESCLQRSPDINLRVRERGLAVVLVSHDMPHVFELADRIHVARLGRRAAVLDPRAITMADAVAVMTGAVCAEELGGGA